LKDTANNFETSALKTAEELGFDLEELPRWNCCGTVYSLTDDNLMKQLGPIRNLVHAQSHGYDRLYTLCSMCDNTLKRANLLVKEDQNKLKKINVFMDQEPDYLGEVEVLHFLQLLRDEVGWERVRENVKNPLNDLNIAPYYGCMLTRPREVGLDDPHDPSVFDDLIEALGANPVDFAYDSECCGSYNTVDKAEVVLDKTETIINGARKAGADLMITSCPLCQFNLDSRQVDLIEVAPSHEPLPVLYFTQLTALAFGHPEACQFSENSVDPTTKVEPVKNPATER